MAQKLCLLFLKVIINPRDKCGNCRKRKQENSRRAYASASAEFKTHHDKQLLSRLKIQISNFPIQQELSQSCKNNNVFILVWISRYAYSDLSKEPSKASGLLSANMLKYLIMSEARLSEMRVRIPKKPQLQNRWLRPRPQGD